MLYPFIRLNRAIAAILINPSQPIQSIAISETISVVGPLLNPNLYPKIFATLLTMSYFPHFASSILKLHNNKYTIYNQTEICLLLLFIITYYFEKIYK